MSKIISEEVKTEIVSFYKSKPMSIGDVAKKYHLCCPTIRKILGNIPVYTKTQIFNPYIQEDFFENIDTEEKAYFLGLIISDGNVFDPSGSEHGGQKWVSITLDDDDKYMLENFRECIKASTKVASDGRGSSYVVARSDKMADDLSKYGVVPRKSFITRFPFEVEKSLYRHIIRGIIDGDGSIQAYNRYTERDNRNRFYHKIACCGSHRLMCEMVDVIKDNIDLEFKEVGVYDYKKRVLSEFRISNINDMFNFGKWMYDGSTVFLYRKRDSFDNFVRHYGLA